MSLRYELASLLAGFDVERVRTERDGALMILGEVTKCAEPLPSIGGSRFYIVHHDPMRWAVAFLNTLPIGAVEAARKRLAKGRA